MKALPWRAFFLRQICVVGRWEIVLGAVVVQQFELWVTHDLFTGKAAWRKRRVQIIQPLPVWVGDGQVLMRLATHDELGE